MNQMNRRDALRVGTAAVLTTLSARAYAASPTKPRRVGLSGGGWFGKHALTRLIQIEPVEVVALCDADRKMMERAGELIQPRHASKKMPRLYGDYRKMLAEKDLDIVLVGLNPSIPSAQTGHYFANPRNRFWPAFNGAEMTPEPLSAETDYRVLEYGIGMTDLVKRPTPGVGDLKAADFRTGAAALKERLLPYAPRIVCFHGVVAYRNFLRYGQGVTARPELGLQRRAIGVSKVYVVPNPSPANAAFSLDDIVVWYARLRAFREETAGDR